MKRILISVITLLLSATTFAGNNDIYITQTGTGLTLTIDQIGATNTIGTSSARAVVSGTTMTIDIDQIGSSNAIVRALAYCSWSSRNRLVFINTCRAEARDPSERILRVALTA